MLRSGALSDPRVIELVNREFVPVWVNVRERPLPRLPALKHALVNAEIDEDYRVKDLFSQGFFSRSVVLSPDGQVVLNPQVNTIAAGLGRIITDGTLGYAEANPGAYLMMLRRALERHRGQDVLAAATPAP